MATLIFPLACLIVGLRVITTIACLAVTRITGNAHIFLATAPALCWRLLCLVLSSDHSGRGDGGGCYDRESGETSEIQFHLRGLRHASQQLEGCSVTTKNIPDVD